VEAQALGAPALIGLFDRAEGAALRRAVERADSSAHWSTSILEAQDQLSELRPRCIFVEGEPVELLMTTAWLRDQPLLFSTPVIAIVSELRDESFVRAYRNGADDVIVRSNVAGVTRRLANLRDFDPSARPPISRGQVLISHQDDDHRRLLGRVLRQASFDVRFAADSGEIVEAMASEEAPVLVVASDEVLPVSEIQPVRRSANAFKTPFVVVTAAASTRTMLHDTLERVATISESAPNDHLLFLANDLLTGGSRHMRESPRYLFDTICSFRADDTSSPDHGLTYNVSETGIYVRTFDPPPKDTIVRLELTPPGSTETVELRGTIIWTAMPGKGTRATPPGFGVHIETLSSPARDLELYQEAYRALGELPNRVAVTRIPKNRRR